MSWDTKPLIKTQGEPAPQAYDPTSDIYKVVQSTGNALWTVLKDNAGNFIGVTNGKLNIRASELETILNTLATTAKQDTIISHIDGLEGLLTAIKDTSGIKKITDPVSIGSSVLPTGAATSSKQDTIISNIDGIEGLLTTLNTYVDELETVLKAIRDTTGIKKITDAITVTGNSLAEQKTQANAVNGVITFSANISTVEIYNTDVLNDGVFTVNGIAINVPKGTTYKSTISGTPGLTVTVTGSTSYIVSRYV